MVLYGHKTHSLEDFSYFVWRQLSHFSIRRTAMPLKTTISRNALLQLFFVSLCIASGASHGEEIALILEDFDGKARLQSNWQATGTIEVQRNAAPKPQPTQGVEGQLITCRAEGPSRITTKTRQRPNFENFDTIQLRIQVENASADAPKSFEFQAHSPTRSASLWRKFVVSQPNWQIIRLPMQHFRYSAGARLEWEEVSNFGIAFRDQGTVHLDRIELVASQSGSNPFFTPEEIGKTAFGAASRVASTNRFALITNDQRVDAKATLAECEQLFKLIYDDFPEAPRPSRPVPILIFRTEQGFRRFWHRLAKLYAASVPPVRSAGYSLFGIAGTFYSDEFGPVRPVLIHEACHALLARSFGLSNSSEWLHEGLANYYQLHWTKQDAHKLNRARIRNGKHRPLRELLNGQRIAMRDYAQATLFVKWLIEHDAYKEQFAKALQEMRKRNSTEFEPICERHFGKPLDELELDWLRWARAGN